MAYSTGGPSAGYTGGTGGTNDQNKKKNRNHNGGGGGGGTPTPTTNDLQIVPGKANRKNPGQMNVVDYAGQVVGDPSSAFIKDNPATPQNESMFMGDHLTSQAGVNAMNEAGTVNPNDPNFQMNATPTVNAQQVGQVAAKQANSYDVKTSQENMAANGQMTAAQGQLSAGSQVTAAQADMKGLGTGTNADGTINYAGEALKKYAAQDMSNIIDTSTAAGKLLASQLGEGNYTDSKATLKGQLDILQNEFVDPVTGEPKIPSWAAATARNVSKIAAFNGMSGSAATAAMSQALLEASIPVAQADSQFFQTLTLQNLSNKQQSVINTANTLAKFEQTNVDNRMAAAIQNSKAFLEMDMKNLDNDQQARIINNQAMVQSILEDSKQENAKRLFVADNQNQMDKFYDELNVGISKFNSSQTLDADKFNADMEDSRERFYKEMQYNIAISNAKWRQTVQLQEDQQAHEAGTMDVKNMYDMDVNQLNQIWDRSDAMLDYAWQSIEKQKDRNLQLALQQLIGDQKYEESMMTGLGTLLGGVAGSDWFGNAMGGLFS